MQVVLRVSMPSDLLLPDAELEVLQFEPYETPSTCSVDEKPQQQGFPQSSGDPSEGLLQWLLPLDRPSSPPQPTLLPGLAGCLSLAQALQPSSLFLIPETHL